MYKVVNGFTDLQDGNYSYSVGDTYPRKGYTAADKRIKELAGTKNRLRRALIEYVEDKVEEIPKETPSETPTKETKTRKRSK